jgi:hypothetical protein
LAVSGVFASPLLAQGACESAKLLAADGAAGDDFGASVAVSGTVAVIGAPEDDDAGSSSGAAYVFSYDGSSWTQQQKLTASDADSGDDYGFSVAISGNTIVVGSARDDTIAGSRAGSAYVYTFDGDSWGNEVHLFASDAGADDRFGYSVAIDGDTILVGAIQWDGTVSNAGAGYVFVGSGLVWSEQDKLTADEPSGTNPHLGHSASLDGDVAVLGAWQDAPDGMFSVGAAHVFGRSGITWSEAQKLTASDAADFRWFGQSVSVSGDVIAVGAYGDRADDLSESGGAYFFTWDGLDWQEQNNVNATDPEANDRFGWSIAVDGDNAVIGTGTSASKAYLFHRELIDWSQLSTLNSSDPDVSGEYAYSVALAGATAVIGDRGGASGRGVAFVFDLLGLDCICPWDCGDPPDDEVSVLDFLALLGQWGSGGTCDVDGGGVGVTDFLALLAHWGGCP